MAESKKDHIWRNGSSGFGSRYASKQRPKRQTLDAENVNYEKKKETDGDRECGSVGCKNKPVKGQRCCSICNENNVAYAKERTKIGDVYLIDRGVPECLKPENLPKKPPTRRPR